MMNRAYRLVWSRVKHQWIAVGERTSAHGKSKSTLLASKAAKASRALALAAGVSLLAVPGLAGAATIDYSGFNSWTSLENWVGGVQPATTDDARIDGDSRASIRTGDAITVNKVIVGNAGIGMLIIEGGGTLATATAVSGTGILGGQNGSYGRVGVDGTGSSWSLGNLSVGALGSGKLSIYNGGSVTASGGILVGDSLNSSGWIGVEDGGALNIAGYLAVGSEGSGTLTIEHGGSVTSGASVIGGAAGGAISDATVSGVGSLWNATTLTVAESGEGYLTISNGGVVSVGGGGNGTLDIASYVDSTGVLVIGDWKDFTAVAPGTLNAAKVAFGTNVGAESSNGTVMFNHTSTAYDFAPAITGAGSIDLYAGTTRFAGDLSQYVGTMTVDGGTLSIASGDTLYLGSASPGQSNYTQTANGTLKIGVANDSSYGKLIVDGDVFLDGALFVDAASASLTGTKLTGIIQTLNGRIVDGTFASYSDNSSLFNFTPVYREDGVDLTVTAAGSGGGGSGGGSGTSTASTDLTAYSAVTAMGNSPAVGAARVLDSIFQSNPTGGISQLFYSLNGTQAVSNAVAQTLPLMTASMNRVAINSLHSTNRVIQARQDANVGMSSGDDFLGDRKIWLKPVGSWARQDNRKGVAGYDADTFGLIGGADGTLNEATRIGVAFSYMNSNVDGKSTSSSNSAEIDAYQLITYGSHDLAALPDTAINWQADIGINKNEGRRAITFGGLNRVAKSDYDSLAAHVGIGLSRNYALSEKTTITSGLRADYTWLRDEGYIEKGADALNLQVKGHSTDELILMAEGRISHKLGDKSVLIGNAGIGYDVLDSDTSITASYVGGGTAFQTTGLDMSPWLSRAGMGLVYNASDTTEITARYDIEARSDFLDQTASVKVRWAF